MPRLTTRAAIYVVLFIWLFGGRSLTAQIVDGNRFYTIENGALVLNGTYEGLAGIDTHSNGGFLGLDSISIPEVGGFDLKEPFPNSAVVVRSEPTQVTIGVLGAANRIDISGSTLTSILYSETIDVARGGDLTVHLGLGDTTPAQLLPETGNEAAQYYADIVDGHVTLNFSFPQFRVGALHVESSGAALSLDDGMLPFALNAIVKQNTPEVIRLGVADANDRIGLDAQSITSILYPGDTSDAANELVLQMGLGRCGTIPVIIPFGIENAVDTLECNTTNPQTTFTDIGGVSGDGVVGGDGLYATLLNGHVVLNGTFQNLAGIEATSIGRQLRLNADNPTAPFLNAEIAMSDPRQVSLGVLNSTDRVSVEGVTTTAIQYGSSIQSAIAKQDLAIDLRLAECGRDLASLPIGVDAAVAQLTCDGGTTGARSLLPDYVNIVDGVITIQGEFDRVSAIEARSRGGHLSLETEEIDGEVLVFSSPFDQATDVSISASPTRVELGVLSSQDRVDIQGETVTSIQYGESLDIAGFDLGVFMTHSPDVDPPVVDGFFALNDGKITFRGTIEQLAGLDVFSAGGYLALESTFVPGIGDVDLKAPFPTSAAIVENSANRILIGVLGAENRIDIEGDTATSILYNGPPEQFLNDVTIAIGIGNGPPVSLPVIPEPSSLSLLYFGVLGLALRGCRSATSSL